LHTQGDRITTDPDVSANRIFHCSGETAPDRAFHAARSIPSANPGDLADISRPPRIPHGGQDAPPFSGAAAPVCPRGERTRETD
jgi:hypothetical protein